MDPTYFRDGYTQRKRINAVRGLHGELKFEMRPCSPAKRDRMYRLASPASGASADKINAATCELIAEQVVSWDCHDDQGKSMPVAREIVAGLPPSLYDKVYWVVMGRDPGDLVEEASGAEGEAWLSQLTDTKPGVADAKNSQTG